VAPASRRNRGSSIKRLIRLRLVVPLLRGRHPPDYTARGVFYGLLIGLTPTVGIQMPIVLLVWLLLRSLNKEWDFNVIVGMAWVWISNAFTVPPFYYTFFVTGQLMLGRFDDVGGYAAFTRDLASAVPADVGFFELVWVSTVNLFDLFGVPMFVGCIPWAVAGAWIGYKWSHSLVVGHRRRKIERLAARRRSRVNPSVNQGPANAG